MSDQITITGLTEVTKRLGTLQSRMSNLQPVLAEIGNMVANTADESFENQKSPWGEAWTPNADKTIEQYARRKGKGQSDKKRSALAAEKQILMVDGLLRSSITHEADGESVTVSAGRIYAAIHQFGGKAGRGRSVTLPARPYMPIRDDVLWEGTQNEINGYLMSKLIEAVAGNGGMG